jgi:hypothetical protein
MKVHAGAYSFSVSAFSRLFPVDFAHESEKRQKNHDFLDIAIDKRRGES